MPERLRRAAYSIDAMRELARRRLPRPIFDFADGGAEDETTLKRSEAAYSEIEFLPRPLNGAGTRDISVTLFGQRLSMPVVIGPTGLAGLFWPGGEICAARAATAAGTAFCLSHASVCTIEDLAATGAGPRWMQVFIYRDRGFTRELAERAAQSGFDALILTVDNQMTGNRERDIRNGFTIPPRLGPAELAAMALKCGWSWRMRRDLGRITFGNYLRAGETADLRSLASRMPSLLDPSMSWKDVEELRAIWKRPLLLKGILHPEEARRAGASGVDGIIVSNHGGRQLDGTPASIDVLPGVVAAVEGRIPVLIDGGIRRGSDIVKAVALGAAACLIGRPTLWGLAVSGEEGVRRVLDIYRIELDRVMALLGAARLSDLGPDLLFRPR